MLQADLAVTEVTLGNAATQQAIVRLGGYFYKTASGNIYTVVLLGDRGNGLEAWYEIQELDDSIDTSLNVVSYSQGSLSSGTLALNTPYTSSISFDGNNTFTFIFNNGSPVNASGPTRTGLPDSLSKFVGTSLRFGQKNSTVGDINDVSPDDGTAASISATIDNVITSATTPAVLDDFAAANLDITKWDKDEGSTEIVNNQLVMKTKQQGSGRSRQRLYLRKPNVKTLGAKVTLLSSSIGPIGTRIRGRVVTDNWERYL